MIQLTELQSMRDTLQRAIFSGTRRVQFTDRAVEYNSVDDMHRALADINAEITKASGPVPTSFSLVGRRELTALQLSPGRWLHNPTRTQVVPLTS